MTIQSKITVATWLTLSRLLVAPLLPLLALRAAWLGACACLGWGLASDYLDGWWARRRGQVSPLGALLDPIADKALILAGFAALVATEPGVESLPWVAGVVAFRNLAQLAAIPILLGWLKIPFHVRPKFLPKLATALAMTTPLVFWVTHLLPHPELAQALHAIATWILLPCVTGLELFVACGFVSRFIAIASRRHDTFE